jgi:hypothetical protein
VYPRHERPRWHSVPAGSRGFFTPDCVSGGVAYKKRATVALSFDDKGVARFALG